MMKQETPISLAQEKIRAAFPALTQEVNGRPLTYLDTAASALKPQAVIEAMSDVMSGCYANFHRGLYQMSQETTRRFEQARETAASFLNTHTSNEIVFTRNATEALNLIATSWAMENLEAGDKILLTELEHHANIVPWHFLREKKGIELLFARVDENGNLDLDDFVAKAKDTRVKLASFAHLSNALGTRLPVEKMVTVAKQYDVVTVIDGCQAVMHEKVDVRALGCDFYVFSGHKLYGPSGIGVLYGREDMLNAMPPYQGGGDMIETVAYDKISYKAAPGRFEAGTPAIVEAIGLASAINYLEDIGYDYISQHEQELYAYLCKQMSAIPAVRLIGAADERQSVYSFVVDGVHPHDMATLLDKQGVAVRVGHHCAEPIMTKLGVPSGTIRASIGLYNTKQDVDRFVEAVKKAISFF